MTILWGGLYIVSLVGLLGMLGVHPQAVSRSRFALRRRARAGDRTAAMLLKKQQLMRDIFSLQRVVAAVLLVLLSVLGVELFHWAVGIMVSLVIALESGAVARIGPWQQVSQRLYERHEAALLGYIERHPLLFRAIRSVAPLSSDAYDIESPDELLAMVRESGDALSPDEKKLIINGLTFASRLVSSVMTPRSVIETVSKHEVVGPVVLDELHRRGYSRYPVIDGDIDHVVGMLYLQELVAMKPRAKAPRVATVMERQVYYIHQDQTLQHALAAFLRTRHHLFVVVNAYRETVGLLSLEDVIEALLGREIVDEFDRHEDLRRVAERNPRHNNPVTKTNHDV